MPTIKTSCPYEVVIKGVDLRSGQTINNVLYYRSRPLASPLAYGASIADSDLATFLDNISLRWQNTLDPVLSEHYRLETITGKQVISFFGNIDEPQTLVYGEMAVATLGVAGFEGDRPGEALPTYCAMSVRKITDRAGRRFRGSMRLGPIVEADQVNGTFTGAAHTANIAACNGFIASNIQNGGLGIDSEMILSLLSKVEIFFANAPLIESDSFTARVTSLAPHKNLGSQTSRKVRSDRLISEVV